MAANEVVHMVRFVFLLGFKQEAVGDAHVELLQILVNNCQRPDCNGKAEAGWLI